MQLKKINTQMSMAACALLQVAAPATNAAASENEWEIDSSVLIYSESDSRVSVLEPAVRVGVDLGDDEFVSFQLVVDALTGATPNGAHKSTVVQTFTNPSGNGTYTVQPGELPMSTTFKDTRFSLEGEWNKPLDRLSSVLLGASLSGEVDYISLGLSGTYEHELNNKNTTLAAGLALTLDTIDPIGGVPKGLNPMRVGVASGGGSQERDGKDDTKNSVDLLLGVTQIIDRKTLVQFNYTHGTSSGYHNDYNNVLTVYDPLTNAPLVGDWLALDANDLPYLFEKRPDSRSKDIFYVKGVRHLEEDVINLSYRLYSDDWGITSHTLDFKYRYELDNSYLQPTLRYYTQSSADFYKHNLKVDTDIDRATGNVNVPFASNDYRLAEFDSVTLGLKYGMPLGENSEFSIRGQLINQTISNSGVPASEATPDLSAIVLQVSYSLLW